jgi:flagellar protein FliS
MVCAPILTTDSKSALASDYGMNAYQVYRQTQAETAAPGELVVMLYRGAARFVGSAVEAIEARNVQAAHNNLIRAQAVISELAETLDLAGGGEIATNLTQIYEYMNYRLVEANLRKDAAPAREVEQLLRELLPAWEQAARETTGNKPTRRLVAAA